MPAYWVTRNRRGQAFDPGYDEYRDGTATGWVKVGDLCVTEKNGNYYFRRGTVYLPMATVAAGLSPYLALEKAKELTQ